MKRFFFAIGVAAGASVISLLIAATWARLAHLEDEAVIAPGAVWMSSTAVLIVALPVLFRLAPWWLRIEPRSGRTALLLPITMGIGIASFALLSVAPCILELLSDST